MDAYQIKAHPNFFFTSYESEEDMRARQNPVEIVEARNRVVGAGLVQIMLGVFGFTSTGEVADGFTNIPTLAQVNSRTFPYIQAGTGTTPVTAADTQLVTPALTKAIVPTFRYVNGAVRMEIAVDVALDDAGHNSHFREAGILMSSAAATGDVAPANSTLINRYSANFDNAASPRVFSITGSITLGVI